MPVNRCNRCKRILRDEQSIAVGLGPVCFQRITGRRLSQPKPRVHCTRRLARGESAAVPDQIEGQMSLSDWLTGGE